MQVDPARKRMLTVPNAVTVLRLAMAVAAAWILAAASRDGVALALLAAAALLDAFDGWYARRFAQCTSMGEHLDPLADKVLVGVLFIAVAARFGLPPVWWMVGAIGAREAGMTFFRAWSRRRYRRMIPARRLGKLKMFLQSVTGLVLLGSAVVPGGIRPPDAVVVAVVAIVLGVSWGSALAYARDWRAMRELARAQEAAAGRDAVERPLRRAAGGRS